MDQTTKSILQIFKRLYGLGIISQRQYDVIRQVFKKVEFTEYIKAEITESYIMRYMESKKDLCMNDYTVVELYESIVERKKKLNNLLSEIKNDKNSNPESQ